MAKDNTTLLLLAGAGLGLYLFMKIIQNPYYTVLILGSWWANLSLTFLKGVIDNVGQGGQC